MAGSIREFISSFKTDVARPSRFDVMFNVPSGLLNIPFSKNNPAFTFADFPNKLSMRCDSATLPGRTIGTLEQKFGANPIERYAYQSAYEDAQFTFIVSDDMYEKTFFDAWMEYIHPTDRFDFKYKKDYSTSITVNQYSVTNAPTYSVLLKDAFPIAVNQLDLNWADTDHHKLAVVFAYSYWQVQ
jgi:hypothetical protein